MSNLEILCKYRREGSLWGHWCNLCPPLDEYRAIERAHELALKNQSKKKKKK